VYCCLAETIILVLQLGLTSVNNDNFHLTATKPKNRKLKENG